MGGPRALRKSPAMLMICGDTELTMLCAEAMGFEFEGIRPPSYEGAGIYIRFGPADGQRRIEWYDPLNEDRHAMALVKKFAIRLIRITHTDGGNQWSAAIGFESHALEDDLNRAIVLCVAQKQAQSGWHELDAAPQAGKTRTAPTIAEEHPEKPAVAAFSSPAMDYEVLWQRAKEKAKRTMDLRYPPEERDGREREEHSLAVKFYAEMTKA